MNKSRFILAVTLFAALVLTGGAIWLNHVVSAPAHSEGMPSSRVRQRIVHSFALQHPDNEVTSFDASTATVSEDGTRYSGGELISFAKAQKTYHVYRFSVSNLSASGEEPVWDTENAQFEFYGSAQTLEEVIQTRNPNKPWRRTGDNAVL